MSPHHPTSLPTPRSAAGALRATPSYSCPPTPATRWGPVLPGPFQKLSKPLFSKHSCASVQRRVHPPSSAPLPRPMAQDPGACVMCGASERNRAAWPPTPKSGEVGAGVQEAGRPVAAVAGNPGKKAQGSHWRWGKIRMLELGGEILFPELGSWPQL